MLARKLLIQSKTVALGERSDYCLGRDNFVTWIVASAADLTSSNETRPIKTDAAKCVLNLKT